MKHAAPREPMSPRNAAGRLARTFARRRPVERVALTVRPTEHFTRLWPTPGGYPADAPLFLLAVAPLRLAALGLLWATSSPGRLLVGLAVAALLLVAVLVLL